MFSKKISLKRLIIIFVAIFSFSISLIFTYQITTAQFFGLQNQWAIGPFLGPYQNIGQYQFQNVLQQPLQSSWQTPYQFQSPWQQPWQSSWQTPYQFQNAWQQPWQSSWQTPYQFQSPWQQPWQNQWQSPWQSPWQNPWQSNWQTPQYQAEDIDLDAADDGSDITVTVGETIGIVLESNASTGYQWVLDTSVLDPNVVTKVSNQYFPGYGYGVGVPGSEQWIFKAEAEGNTTIKLDYKRLWETSIQDTFQVDVAVE